MKGATRANNYLLQKDLKSHRTIKLLPSAKRLKNASEDLSTSRVKKLSIQINVMNLILERNQERSNSMANVESSLQRRMPLLPGIKLSKSPGFEKYYFSKAIGKQVNTDQAADCSLKLRALERNSLQNRVLELYQSIGTKKKLEYSPRSDALTDNLGTLP
jgi:hypothetical protein